MRRWKPARFASAALRKPSGQLTTRMQIEAHFYAALSGTCELLVSAEWCEHRRRKCVGLVPIANSLSVLSEGLSELARAVLPVSGNTVSSVFELTQCEVCDTYCRWGGEWLPEEAVEWSGCSNGSTGMRRRKPVRFGSAALRKLPGRLTTRIQMEADFYAALSGTCELLRYMKNRIEGLSELAHALLPVSGNTVWSVFKFTQCEACDTYCRGVWVLQEAVEWRGRSEGSTGMRRRKPARFASAALRKL
ncbi:hypothetical protein Efla_007417 [Eimeria flavescens]